MEEPWLFPLRDAAMALLIFRSKEGGRSDRLGETAYIQIGRRRVSFLRMNQPFQGLLQGCGADRF